MRHQHIQRELRSAIAIAYELRRHEHVQNREWVAEPLAELEAELLRIEAKLGGPRAHEIFPSALDLCLDDLDDVIADAGPIVADQIRALMKSVRRLQTDLRQLAPRRAAAAQSGLTGAFLGAAAAFAPFFFGYAKRAPGTSAVQVVLGLMLVMTALGLGPMRAARRRGALN